MAMKESKVSVLQDLLSNLTTYMYVNDIVGP